MQSKCNKCHELADGIDLGDHPAFLEFDCECGESWGEDITGYLIDQARERYKYRGLV